MYGKNYQFSKDVPDSDGIDSLQSQFNSWKIRFALK
jgi:hypothetical protein